MEQLTVSVQEFTEAMMLMMNISLCFGVALGTLIGWCIPGVARWIYRTRWVRWIEKRMMYSKRGRAVLNCYDRYFG